MRDQPVLFDVDGDVATITLNRPDAGNAINLESAEALFDIAICCELDPTIRCVVLKGNGKLFCGGGDIGGFLAAGEEIAAYLSELAGVLHIAVQRFARMPKPLLVAVNGPAAGAGMSLAIGGDIVVAARSSSFTTAYGGIGLSPDGGMSWHLPRLVGIRLAQELLLTGRRVSADEALAIGLVMKVVEDGDLDKEIASMARKLADGPVNALGRTKDLLYTTFRETLESQLEREIRMITQSGSDAESSEGISAFIEKRKANFKDL